jgi:hypothetical protein
MATATARTPRGAIAIAPVTASVPPSAARAGSWALDALLWGWLLAVAGWTILLRFTLAARWDSLIFMLLGRWLPYGVVPYRDALEFKPPAIFLYLASLFAIFTPAVWVVRLGELVWSVVAVWALVRLLAAETGRVATAVAATAWLYWQWDYGFSLGGIYTEQYAAIAALVALACRRPMASGMWLAAATLFKHPGAAVVVPILIYRWRSWSARDWGTFAAAAAAPVLLIVIAFAAVGALPDFLYANLWALQAHARLAEFDLGQRFTRLLYESWVHIRRDPMLSLAVLLGVGAALRTLSPLAVAAAWWWVVGMIAIMLQANFFEHHFTLVLPAVALLGASGLGWLLKLRAGDPLPLRAVRVFGTLLVLWWGWGQVHHEFVLQRTSTSRSWEALLAGPSAWPRDPGEPLEIEVGTYLRDHTTPADRVHVQGWARSILAVYWQADRLPAVPLFYEIPYILDRDRQLEQLRAARPLYVVTNSVTQPEPLRTWLLADYDIEKTVAGAEYPLEIWRRRS